MRATAAIAVNVFRESVRDKVLYNLVLFAVVLIGASYMIGQLTAGQDVKIIKDLGLAATSVFGLFIAVFIGIGLVSKEVERRSVEVARGKWEPRDCLVVRLSHPPGRPFKVEPVGVATTTHHSSLF